MMMAKTPLYPKMMMAKTPLYLKMMSTPLSEQGL
jgi:hypothetical protein